MPAFILLDNLQIKKQKEKDKNKRLKKEVEKKLSIEKEKCNKLEKDIHNKEIENKILKSKKNRINIALQEVELKNELEELKSKNEIEEIKIKNKKEIELLDEEKKNQVEFVKKENNFYLLKEKMKYEKNLLMEQNSILTVNLKDNFNANYEKVLQQEKLKKEKEFKQKEKGIYSGRLSINLKRQKSGQFTEQIMEKNKLEIKIAQMEMINDNLRRKNDNLSNIGNKYNILTEKVKQKIEKKIITNKKIDENIQKNNYSKYKYTTFRNYLKNNNYY